MNMLDEAKTLLDEMTRHRRYIHQNAELGDNLPLTTAYVMRELRAMGYEPREICKSGVSAVAGTKGKAVLLRADMDALPVAEETDLPFKSVTGYMHACGHDMHAAMLLGAARLLKNHEAELPGRVTLMFQPAEEGPGGAGPMIEAGVLENPKVEAAFAAHVLGASPHFKNGGVICASGPYMASCDNYRITIRGKGGHGAMPYLTVDPINVGAHIVLALQTINARETNVQDPLVLTFGRFSAGSAPNVIPDTAILEYTLRTFDEDLRQHTLARIRAIMESTAAMFGASIEEEDLVSFPPLKNDPALAAETAESLRSLLGKDNVVMMSHKVMGSEDFSLISQLVPSCYMIVPAIRPEAKYQMPQHHPKVDFEESSLAVGAAALARAAVEWLERNG